ncbi:hypothetical protein LTR37_008406 [Vermiconidia calcicola]|uniref:Uncharacterized protein n=1 Tax=Vermiconidia calcicola TaxID=1690605 RepID=A0ACC3NAE7_9PEZI|nr:hypothetical protein LTR37_008406 [Vermiconidia calcicola]
MVFGGLEMASSAMKLGRDESMTGDERKVREWIARFRGWRGRRFPKGKKVEKGATPDVNRENVPLLGGRNRIPSGVAGDASLASRCKKLHPSGTSAGAGGARSVETSTQCGAMWRSISDAYSRGYQDGFAAAAPRSDSGNPFSDEHATISQITNRGTGSETESATPHELMKRGFKLGWNKAWKAIREAGWTQGCQYCSQTLRHRNVVPQMKGVDLGGEFQRVGAQATFI